MCWIKASAAASSLPLASERSSSEPLALESVATSEPSQGWGGSSAAPRAGESSSSTLGDSHEWRGGIAARSRASAYTEAGVVVVVLVLVLVLVLVDRKSVV